MQTWIKIRCAETCTSNTCTKKILEIRNIQFCMTYLSQMLPLTLLEISCLFSITSLCYVTRLLLHHKAAEITSEKAHGRNWTEQKILEMRNLYFGRTYLSFLKCSHWCWKFPAYPPSEGCCSKKWLLKRLLKRQETRLNTTSNTTEE